MSRLLALLVVFAASGCATVPNTGALLDPTKAAAQAPEEFTVKLVTTKGTVLIDVVRSWAPNGADRFFNLVQAGYFDGNYFFRTIAGFMSQFGLHGDPAVTEAWGMESIPDDAALESNTKGMVTFAMAGPNTRTTQLFINLKDNLFLDSQGFSPIGKVRTMKVVDKLWVGYGEARSMGGLGPEQAQIMEQGNAYLDAEFPKLDRIVRATIQRGR
jgi:peptidyl-prolyl cis-trans isomerase A (cyclophilin A)